MWAVSQQFMQAIITAPRFISSCTFTPPGGTATPLLIESGQVSLDSTQTTRRTIQSMTVKGDSSVYQALMAPGTVLDVSAGLQYGSSTELVPVFHGELTDGEQDLGAGTIDITAGDMNVRLARNRFESAFTPGNVTRIAAITQALTGAIPGVGIVNLSSDRGSITTATSWASQSSPVDVISDLSKDGGTEVFQRPDGLWVIRDRPVIDSPSVWTLSRSLKTAKRARPLDALYNAVVVTPSAADGSQTWTQQVAELTDTTHPLHKSKIGVSPYFWASPTASTAAAALAAAQSILSRIVGNTQTLALTAVTNPALEGGDVLTVVTPGIGVEPPQSFRHFVDGFTLDLATGEMSLNTRSTQVVSNG